MKAFVTGSTGLLGGNLVNALIEAGYEVKTLARSRQKAEKLFHHSQVEIVVGDMEDIPAFAPHMAGSDVLFHTAGYVHETFAPGDHWPQLEKINVRGTFELLIQAEKYGVGMAIHTSSTSVLGLGSGGAPADENTPPDDFSRADPYARSKLLAEQAIEGFRKTHHLPVVLILPSSIFGPQDPGPSTPGKAVVQILERKLPILPPGGLSVVDVRDVAAAMINAVERGLDGERYVVSKGYVTLEQLAQTVGEVSGVAIPTRRIPYAMLNVLAHASELTSRLTGASPAMGVKALEAMNRRHEVSAEKALRELGVTFRPFGETIRDTADWFLANGYVQPGTRMQAAPA